MPGTPGSAAKGMTGVGVEFTNSGLQSRLTPTLISLLPASLTTPIPATSVNGERMAIAFFNHTAAGTVTITGTSPLAVAAVNETSTSMPVPELPGEVVWYVTSTLFGAVNASGVTLGTGLTGGSILIFGIQQANRLIPGECKLIDKWVERSPMEQRGVFDEDFHLLALAENPEWEYVADLYADIAFFAYLGGYAAAPTQTTLPSPGTAILASTSVVTAGSASAALQPLAPGQILQCVIGGAPATAATVTITGVNIYGETVVEVIVPSTKTAGTFQSSNVFTSIAASGIAFGAFGGTATLTVNGFFGFQYGGNPSETLQSFAMEQYDSIASFCAPFVLVDNIVLEGGAEKECKITAKGPCQQVLPVGNPATTTNQITAFAQPLDKPISGWRAVAFFDPLSGTIGTTNQQDVVDWKVDIKVNWVVKHTSWGIPPTRMWNRVYRKRRKVLFEATMDMTSTTFQNEYEAWKRRSKRLIQFQLRGPTLGVVSGTTYYEGFTLNIPVRYVEAMERDFSTGKESVEVKVRGIAELEASLGYGHQINWYTRIGQW